MIRLQLPPTPDLEDAIAPNSPLLPPEPLLPWWAWMLVGVVLVAVFAWIIYRMLHRPPVVENVRDAALRDLDRLEPEKTPPYEFSIRVSDILRRYVERRFHLPATSQTSDEFLHGIQTHDGFSREERELLGDFLMRCDAVKFAHVPASITDNQDMLRSARSFVRGQSA